jgi:hypothetical protein
LGLAINLSSPVAGSLILILFEAGGSLNFDLIK